MAQADARATGDFNHGVWWAKTAVEMAALRNLQMGKVCEFVCVLLMFVRAVGCPRVPPPPTASLPGGDTWRCVSAETYEPDAANTV
jgi:hypothetical protein